MGFARGIQRALLAKSLGPPFNPELWLWGTYGDATGQPPPDFSDYASVRLPGPWHTLTLEHMARVLRHYGELIAPKILATGVRVCVRIDPALWCEESSGLTWCSPGSSRGRAGTAVA